MSKYVAGNTRGKVLAIVYKYSAINVLMLKSFAGYQASQSLILFALSIRLPPVRVFLGNNVQHVTFLKANSQLPTGNVRVFLGVVVEVCPYVLYLIRKAYPIDRTDQLPSYQVTKAVVRNDKLEFADT